MSPSVYMAPSTNRIFTGLSSPSPSPVSSIPMTDGFTSMEASARTFPSSGRVPVTRYRSEVMSAVLSAARATASAGVAFGFVPAASSASVPQAVAPPSSAATTAMPTALRRRTEPCAANLMCPPGTSRPTPVGRQGD